MELALFLEIPKFPSNTAYDKLKEASLPKMFDLFSPFRTVPAYDGNGVTENSAIRYSAYEFLLAFHSNYILSCTVSEI